MLLAVLSGFLLAIAAPFLHRVAGKYIGWVLALLPASLAVYFSTFLSQVQDGPVLLEYQWLPGLDISLNFLVDGLSLTFGFLF
jgi:multicomponent Na+:H+ antiporter subunit A